MQGQALALGSLWGNLFFPASSPNIHSLASEAHLSKVLWFSWRNPLHIIAFASNHQKSHTILIKYPFKSGQRKRISMITWNRLNPQKALPAQSDLVTMHILLC